MPSYVDSTGVTYLTSDIKALADATYPANSAIINAYSASSAYAVGDFCIHGGLFYKCNTAIASGGEAWNSSHWTQTNVTSEWGTKMVVASITLTAANWTGNGPYTQSVVIPGGTANTKVDLQPSPAIITQMVNDGTTGLGVENNNGSFSAFATGKAPTTNITVQYTRMEVVQA